jgi:hypothetical protein
MNYKLTINTKYNIIKQNIIYYFIIVYNNENHELRFILFISY